MNRLTMLNNLVKYSFLSNICCNGLNAISNEDSIEQYVDYLLQTIISNIIKNYGQSWMEALMELPPRYLSGLVPNRSELNDDIVLVSSLTESIDPKEDFSVVIVGEPHSGKTTLLVQLLYETNHLDDLVNRSAKRSSWATNFHFNDRSLPFYNMSSEMEGIVFETETKFVTILDISNTKDFTPNMIIGTIKADFGIVVLDGSLNDQQRQVNRYCDYRFSPSTVVQNHLNLLKILDIRNLCVLINKMDSVDWCEIRFEDVITGFLNFLDEFDLNYFELTFIPSSILFDHNLKTIATIHQLSNWYEGPCLFNVLDEFIIPKISSGWGPLRMPITKLCKISYKLYSISGYMQSGLLSVNDGIVIGPSGKLTKVQDLLRNGNLQTSSMAGDDVVITLADADLSDIGLGSVIYDLMNPMTVTTLFEACFYFHNIELALFEGDTCCICYQTLTEPATICQIIAEIHNGKSEVYDCDPGCLFNNTCAILQIQTESLVCIDKYQNNHDIGSISLIIHSQTVATGIVTNVYKMSYQD